MSETNGNGWAGLMRSYGVSDATAERLVRSLTASEVAALAFCRLLERWAKGDPEPCTAPRREAALRRAAERAETALAGLERLDPRKCQVVELRFFGGLSVEETAETLNVSSATVARDWTFARTWLRRELKGESGRTQRDNS